MILSIIHTMRPKNPNLMQMYVDYTFALSAQYDKDFQTPMMEQWLEHRSTYLNVLLENEGRSASQACSHCSGDVAYIRCSDCIGGNTFCIPCCLQYHRRSPFHRLLQWNGKHYAPTTLYALGFILCLGHDGNPCPKTVEVFLLS